MSETSLLAAAPGAVTSLVGALNVDIVNHILLFLDMVSLLRMQAADRTDGSVIGEYRTSEHCMRGLVRSARNFLRLMIITLHSACAGFSPEALSSAADEHTEKTTGLLLAPRNALVSKKAVSVWLKGSKRVKDGEIEKWGWKSAIRFLFPMAASYGDIWPDASFALQACARAIKNEAMLVLFKPNPCGELEKLAATMRFPIGANVATVLGAMIRTTTPGLSSIMIRSAEVIAEAALGKATTRGEFSFLIVCMALVEQLKIKKGVSRVAMPARLYSSICLRRSGDKTDSFATDIELFTRLIGIDLDTRFRPRFEQSFVFMHACKRTLQRSHSVAHVLANVFGQLMAGTTGTTGVTATRNRAENTDDGGSNDGSDESDNDVDSAYTAVDTATANSGAIDVSYDLTHIDDAPSGGMSASAVTSTASNSTDSGGSNPVSVDARIPLQAGLVADDTEGSGAIAPEDVAALITPAELAALINEISTQTGTSAADLSRALLTQDAAAIGVQEEEEDEEDSEAAENTASGEATSTRVSRALRSLSDDEDEDDVDAVGGIQTRADLAYTLDTFVAQMAAAADGPTAADEPAAVDGAINADADADADADAE